MFPLPLFPYVHDFWQLSWIRCNSGKLLRNFVRKQFSTTNYKFWYKFNGIFWKILHNMKQSRILIFIAPRTHMHQTLADPDAAHKVKVRFPRELGPTQERKLPELQGSARCHTSNGAPTSIWKTFLTNSQKIIQDLRMIRKVGAWSSATACQSCRSWKHAVKWAFQCKNRLRYRRERTKIWVTGVPV